MFILLFLPLEFILASHFLHVSHRVSKKNAPPLKAVLKKFFLKVHPDRYAQYPTIAKANEQSFALLQSFLQHISGSATDNMPPPAKSEMLVFYTWSTAPKKESEAPKLRKISVNLRTSGGDCPNMVAKTLTDLFAQASVEPSVFTWDEGYWNNGKVHSMSLSCNVNNSTNI